MNVYVVLTEYGEEIHSVYSSEREAREVREALNREHQEKHKCDHPAFAVYEGPWEVQ